MKWLYVVVVISTIFSLRKGFQKVSTWGFKKSLAHIFFVYFLILGNIHGPYMIGYFLIRWKDLGLYYQNEVGIPAPIYFILNILTIFISTYAVLLGAMLVRGVAKLKPFLEAVPIICFIAIFEIYKGGYRGISKAIGATDGPGALFTAVPLAWLAIALLALITICIYFFMYRFYSKNYFGPRN